MNAKNLVLTLAVGALALSSCNSGVNSTTASLKTATDSVSYYIGYMYGTTIQRNGLKDPNMKAIVAGMNAAIQKKEIGTDLQKMQMYIGTYMQQLAMKQAEDNLKNGKEFLAKNAKKSGIDTLSDGIQYKVLKKGDGPTPSATDLVKVHYKGTLIDGSEFDSSYKRGEPAQFQLNQVIPGWSKALQHMPVGSKWQIFLPSDQAYGPRGAGGIIGPNETLIFEVELLDIVQPQLEGTDADQK